MTILPSAEKMASLVSGVTQTMLGLTFMPDPKGSKPQLAWRCAMLPIPGDVPLTVGLSSDESGCLKLGAAMFGCAPTAVDTSMMNDSLCELVNMTAGLLKAHLALNQALGLPRIVNGLQPPQLGDGAGDHHAVVLRAEHVGLVLWIFDGIL
jgi:CheY-specific phosphatase CheX